MSSIPSCRAQFSDSNDVRHGVLTMRRSITRSRKRKLRELFAVATAPDGLPNFSLEHLDTPPTNALEISFLDASDISLYVSSF